MEDPAGWASLLGAGAALFVAAGLFQCAIGVGTTIYVAFFGDGDAFLFTAEADAKAFGAAPDAMVDAFPGLHRFRTTVWVLLAAFLLTLGALETVVAWIPLRQGAAWAALVLSCVALVSAAFWVWVLRIYTGASGPVSPWAVPPFMWVPALLHLPAIALVWSALRAG